MHVGLHFWNATIHQSSQDKMRGYKNLIIMHQCTTHENKRKGAPIAHTQVNKIQIHEFLVTSIMDDLSLSIMHKYV